MTSDLLGKTVRIPGVDTDCVVTEVEEESASCGCVKAKAQPRIFIQFTGLDHDRWRVLKRGRPVIALYGHQGSDSPK